MGETENKAFRHLASNRKALREYFVLERIEAGLALQGTEVKSLRAGEASLAGAYALADGAGIVLQGLTIPPYEYGNRFNHEPNRPRRLLLHAREIRNLKAQIEQQGRALIPLRLYLKRGRVKVELGLCKGKTGADKRETLRRKTAEREAERAMAARR